MVGHQALMHAVYQAGDRVRREMPLGIAPNVIKKQDRKRFIIDAPIQSLDDALALPGTLFDSPPPDVDAAITEALTDAIAKSETRIDDELAETAAAWLDIPVEVFDLTPLDEHETCTAREVATVATALGQSLDVVIQLDERKGPPIVGRLGHSSYSSRRILTYMQKKKSRNLYIVATAMQALLLRTAGLAHHIPRLDAVLLAVRPINVAYPAGSSVDVPALDDQQRALARDMTSMIEVAALLKTPALLQAIERVEDENQEYPHPSAVEMARGFTKRWPKEKWADEHCVDAAQKHRVKALIRRCREDMHYFEDLCDPSSDIGAAWRQRIEVVDEFPCEGMIGSKALQHEAEKSASELRRNLPLSIHLQWYEKADKGRAVVGKPIRSLDAALGQPKTILSTASPQVSELLANAVSASTTRIDADLAVVAADLLLQPAEVFALSPMDGPRPARRQQSEWPPLLCVRASTLPSSTTSARNLKRRSDSATTPTAPAESQRGHSGISLATCTCCSSPWRRSFSAPPASSTASLAWIGSCELLRLLSSSTRSKVGQRRGTRSRTRHDGDD